MQEKVSPSLGNPDERTYELWRAVGEGIAMAFERAPGFEFRSEESGWLVRAGEPWVDFNCALIFPGHDAEQRLDEAVDRFRAHGLPFLVCLVGESPGMRAAACEQGLTCAGPLPLMALCGKGPEPPCDHGLRIEEALSAQDRRALAELSQRCFGMPIDSIERVMPFDRPANPRVHTLTAYREADLVGAVTYTLQDTGAGIWSMMTRPDVRRQGIARAVMLEAISRIRRESSKPIFLVSTPDGKPLYDLLEFQTIDAGSVWTATRRT